MHSDPRTIWQTDRNLASDSETFWFTFAGMYERETKLEASYRGFGRIKRCTQVAGSLRRRQGGLSQILGCFSITRRIKGICSIQCSRCDSSSSVDA